MYISSLYFCLDLSDNSCVLIFPPAIFSFHSFAKTPINLICIHPFSGISSVKQEEQQIDFTIRRSGGEKQNECLCEKLMHIFSPGRRTFGLEIGKFIEHKSPVNRLVYMFLCECAGLTWRFPVVLRPPANIVVFVVLLLEPLNERLEILHEWLGAHFGLTGNHGHGLRPGFTEAQLHHVPVDNTTGQRGGQRRWGSVARVSCRDNYTYAMKHVFTHPLH